MTWQSRAWTAINAASAGLAPDAGLKERMAAVDAAYPFGERAMHPYKVWCKCRRDYLRRWGYQSPTGKRALPLSPMERMMLKAGAR